jgi:hypothetical protein
MSGNYQQKSDKILVPWPKPGQTRSRKWSAARKPNEMRNSIIGWLCEAAHQSGEAFAMHEIPMQVLTTASDETYLSKT